ncbi:hypothetical protein XELAEV_18047875mg [Xenopus laevis]|uniref:Uncharacterized protein n=1 Tax=Xenopus laevis TaxID=8355 RepID=A0A974BWJ3_XENLA|nr:hypothetical protein XELAEV_18047875mg [Xenopus laevis]
MRISEDQEKDEKVPSQSYKVDQKKHQEQRKLKTWKIRQTSENQVIHSCVVFHFALTLPRNIKNTIIMKYI